MWTHTTRRTFVVDMVREVAKVHAFEAVSLRICGRIASCILTQWNNYIPSEKCLLLKWGWIWSIIHYAQHLASFGYAIETLFESGLVHGT